MSQNKSGPAPQLARPVYNLCDSDNDNDSSDNNDDDSDSEASLEIMAPINPPNPKTASSVLNAATKASIHSKPAVTKNSTSKLLSVNLSDSDSDDDDLLKAYNLKRTQKQQKQQQQPPLSQSSTTSSQVTTSRPRNTTASEEKQRERQRVREEKARQKEAEKAAKAKQRALDKEHRERQKQQEKDSKKRQREALQQVSGKYAHDEIALLLDLPIYLNEELALANALSEDFLLHPQPVTYKITNSIQWIRKEYLKGGAKDAVEQLEQKQVENFEKSPYLLMLMEAKDFLLLLDRVGHEVDDNYPALEKYLIELQAKYKRVWKNQEEPRIILLLRQVPDTLDKMWKNHKRNKKRTTAGSSLPTEWELNDAIQWLLIQYQVECIHCPSIESIHANLHKLTRGICEAPYKNQVTELECIKKIKSSNTGERPIDLAQDAWFRQLQQVKGLSEGIALNGVKAYPTIQSLWQAYNQNGGDDATNAALLEDCLHERVRRAKLSNTIFRVLKSDDPREKLT
ncbi:unnamed protein product [Cylindrotheca closterium]|uniref:ERCC4 domain-containing protein n=1 Tax=Cylindrotheca closterium TaxID=2856 RepID=A0AAD2FWJ1_9STRA|nr:unnamed protein product [Cylindrotheca closterium]